MEPDFVEDMSALIEEFEEFEEFEGFECSAFSVLCSALWVEDYSWVRIPVVGEQPYIAEEKLTLIEDRFFLILKVFNVECCNNISPHYLNYQVTNLIYRLQKHCSSGKCKHNVTLFRKCKGKIIYHKYGIQYALFLVLQVHFRSSIFVLYKNYLKEVKDYY